MKHAAAVLALFAAASQALSFTNSNFDLVPGKPFELAFEPAEACVAGCIVLLNLGEAGNLKTARNLTESKLATRSPFVVQPSLDWPAGRLSFQITSASDATQNNWSVGFTLRDEEAASASGTSSSAVSTATGVTATNSGMSAPSSTASTATTSTGVGHATNSSSRASPNTTARNQTTVPSSRAPKPSSTSSPASEVPSSGVDRVTASLALAAGVVAAMAYLN
ncbi:hypothetical protein OCS_01784 [Ophiocordyceps sinensis CO18]|nr:hypothetical protein OCS_01784 [Ophiocordyceps sinensis CO18]